MLRFHRFTRVCMEENNGAAGGGSQQQQGQQGGGQQQGQGQQQQQQSGAQGDGGSAASSDQQQSQQQQGGQQQQQRGEGRQHVDVSRLRAENAALRTLVEQHGIEIPQSFTPQKDSGAPRNSGGNNRREEGDLQTRVEKLEQEKLALADRARKGTINSRLSSIAAEGKFNASTSAVRELARFADLDNDGEVVFNIPDAKAEGGKRTVTANLAAVTEHNLLDPIFLPNPGANGSGSSGGSAAAGNLTPQAIVTHGAQSYDNYKQNRDKVIAAEKQLRNQR